jgi:ATP-dependent DNA helicase UvrD/PcrA
MEPSSVMLNPEQEKAVHHGEGPLLVIAGPGSGKTRVITQRIVHLLEHEAREGADSSLQPENILALTFTDKAALEMKHRVSQALPDLTASPHISTFHSFCYQILRQRHFDRRLLDKIDVWILLRRRMNLLGLDFYQRLAEPGAFLHDLNDFFSRCQDSLVSPEDFETYVRECEERFMAQHPALARQPKALSARAAGGAAIRAASGSVASGSAPLGPEEQMAWEEILKKQELARVFRTSVRLIEDASYSSLSSLISETVRLWTHQPDALERAQNQFKYVLVDEFQDTNYGQVELLRRLVPQPYRITAVGDDDQAIYRFRGASHGAFEMFSKAFPGHRTIYLHRNYRSTSRILRVADAVIARNSRYEAKPALQTENEEGSRIFLLDGSDYGSEATWVADEIQRLRCEGQPLDEVAVLYRAHSHRDLLVDELRRRGIPFSIRGLSILNTPVLRDVMAYLRVVQSPRDNISMTRVLADPRWYFSPELAQRVRLRAASNHCSLSDVLQAAPASDLAGELAASGWSDLQKLLQELRAYSRSAPATPVLNRLAVAVGLAFVPGDPRLSPLETFREFVNEWEEKSETRRLPEFLEYLNYFCEAGGKLEAPEPDEAMPAVKLMTVHAAKGLEFPVVFILGLARLRFPSNERKPVIAFPDELHYGPMPPGDIHIQEERRLFYVAITRARQRLYISSVAKSERQRSRFIDDLLANPALAARDVQMIAVSSRDGKPERPEKRQNGKAASIVSRAGTSAHGSAASGGNKISQAGRNAHQGSLFGEVVPREAAHRSIIHDWAAQSIAVESPDKLRMSATSAEDFLQCPLKYKFGHVMRIPPGPQAALTFGNLMHRSVRHYFELRKSGLPRTEDVENFYLSGWCSAGFDDDYQEESYRKAGLEQLRAFVAANNAITIDPQKVQVEQQFSLDFGDLELEGRIDQVSEIEAKGRRARELIDYKTGRPRTQKDADQSLQLSVYALAARELHGAIPERLTFYNLTDNRAVSSVRTESKLRESLDALRAVARDIRAGEFEARPGFHCRWCSFISICPAHEQEG